MCSPSSAASSDASPVAGAAVAGAGQHHGFRRGRQRQLLHAEAQAGRARLAFEELLARIEALVLPEIDP